MQHGGRVVWLAGENFGADLDPARDILERIVARDPGHQRSHNNLGLVLARTGRGEEALGEFLKGGCSEADAHSNLAFGMALEGRLPEARAHYQKALAASPTSGAARDGLQRLDALAAKSCPVAAVVPVSAELSAPVPPPGGVPVRP